MNVIKYVCNLIKKFFLWIFGGSLKNGLRSIILFILGVVATIWLTNNNLFESYEDKITRKGYKVNQEGYWRAYQDKDKDVIENFLKLKNKKPEQYGALKFDPKFFYEFILKKEDSVLFYSNNKDLLKTNDLCFQTSDLNLDRKDNLEGVSETLIFYDKKFYQPESYRFLQELCKKEMEGISNLQAKINENIKGYDAVIKKYDLIVKNELGDNSQAARFKEDIKQYSMCSKNIYRTMTSSICQLNLETNNNVLKELQENEEYQDALYKKGVLSNLINPCKLDGITLSCYE